MRSLRLINRLHLGLKPHPVRSLLLIRQLQLMRSPRLILRKRRPNPKNALATSSELTATYCVSLLEA
jgi:hypothetical protein